MGACYGAEGAWWDAALNTTYRDLLAAEERVEAENAAVGIPAPGTVEPLRDMQRAWIPFRDAACTYEYAQWGGGTGGPVANAACQMRMTAEQTVELILRRRELAR